MTTAREAMDSITPIGKRCKIADAEHCRDRISELPNDIASLILSYLDIQQVVRTSALSRRWSNCWNLITTLDLDDKFGDYPKERRPILRESFMDFVYRVLAGVNRLHKLSLKARGDYDTRRLLNACIAAAARPEIQELDISIKLGCSDISLPQNLFHCSELVALKLQRNSAVDIPISVSLLKLKTLILFEVRLKDGDSLVRLLSGCPVLEKLQIKACFGANTRVVNISSLTLKKLILINMCLDAFDQHSFVECIALHTPALEYLEIDDNVVKSYKLNKLDHIIDADIGIEDPSDEFGSSYSDAVIGLLDSLSSATTIQLRYFRFMEVTRMYNHQFPKFQSLRSLTITAYFMEWTLLLKLLHSSPYLKTLVMDFKFIEDLPGVEDAWGVPDCLKFHLELVEIKPDGGDADDDARLVDYFKREGKVLKKFTVISFSD